MAIIIMILAIIIGLPYLPPEEIEIIFTNLIAIDPPGVLYFSDYVFCIIYII